MGLNHSHSILSIHRNALIHQRNFFLPMLGIRTTTRQTFLLMIERSRYRGGSGGGWVIRME